MRKLFRLGVAGLLAASSLVVTAEVSSAQPGDDAIDVVECEPSPVPNPGAVIPEEVPVVGGAKVVGPEDPCAEMVRSLVFVGEAVISNGVNFAGAGNPSSTVTALDGGTRVGGTYTYGGQCVLVDWEGPGGSAAPIVSSCTFGTTNGTYYAPDQANPVVNPIGRCIEDGNQAECPGAPGTPGYTGLDWAPQDEISCISTSGHGVSTFSATAASPELGGDAETWSASYHWDSSLRNLRGDIWFGTSTDTPGSAGHPSFGFDAKIEAHAHPNGALNGDAGVNPLLADGTDAACLQKTVAANAATGLLGNARTGANNILIVGTASWKTVVPTTLA